MLWLFRGPYISMTYLWTSNQDPAVEFQEFVFIKTSKGAATPDGFW